MRLDIRKPLMRGVTLDVGEGEKEKLKWCPLVYEYLLDFCYTCGLIGHIDRSCDIHVEKGATQQFSRALRFIPEKRKFWEERGKPADFHSQLPWRSSRGRGASGSGSWGSCGRKGSDSDNWRKGDKSEELKRITGREEPEVMSPLKETKFSSQAGGVKEGFDF